MPYLRLLPGAQSAQGDELQEVVVTAERRATNIQATPIAVTAISGDELQTRHLTDINSLQTTVPSFQSNSNGQFNSINIRGMGNSAITPVIATGVAVIRDGLQFLETIGEDQPMYDVRDVEVLEGPQGTFIGAESTAGAVEITSNPPVIGGGVHGFVTGQLGDFNDKLLQGAVNLPVSDTFAARIAFNDEHRNSFSYNVAALTAPQASPITDPGHFYDTDFRVSLLWKPSDNLTALGIGSYTYIQRGGTGEEPNPGTYTTLFSAGPQDGTTGLQGTPGQPGYCPVGNVNAPYGASQMVCPAPGAVSHTAFWYPGEKPLVTDYYGQGETLDELEEHASLRLDYTFGDGIDLRSVSGAVRISQIDINNMSNSPWDAGTTYHWIGPDDDYYSQEFDLISPTTGPLYGKLNWVAGAYWNYRDTPTTGENYVVAPPALTPAGTQSPVGPQPSVVAFGPAISSSNRSAAVFGQIQWAFAPTMQLQLGARENWDNNFSTNDGVSNAPAPGTIVPHPEGLGVYGINYNADGTLANYTTFAQTGSPSSYYKDSVPTGKVDLNWNPTPRQNFYAFYAIGYKSGGANGGSTDHPVFNPEHVDDYELGWKGSLFDGHMLTQLGAYYINYQNLQYYLFDTVQSNDTTTGNYVGNLATSKIYGFSFAEQSRFGPLGINLALAYNKSKLGSVDTVPAYQLPPSFGGNAGAIPQPQCETGHTYAAPLHCFNYTPYLA